MIGFFENVLHLSTVLFAFALKLRAAARAKAAGVAVLPTQNHTVNGAMLAINGALGFVRQPAWVRLKKPL